jgi:hypothetical protein
MDAQKVLSPITKRVDVAVETAYHQLVGYTTREVISVELNFIVLKPKQLIISTSFFLFLDLKNHSS